MNRSGDSSHPPAWLLIGVYFLYLGLATTASVPLFADIDWMHEGERMGTAQILLDGGLPFRDVYLPHGLFDEAIRPLLAFSIFGESLAADRLAGLFLEPLAYVAAAAYVWKVFPMRSWRIVGLLAFALYPLLLLPRHIMVFLTLGLLTVWVSDRRPALLFWAGLLTGLSFVFSTFDHATFLLVMVLLFPVAIKAEDVIGKLKATRHRPHLGSDADFPTMALPIMSGLGLGLLPCLGYMALTKTLLTFAGDFVSRMQADAYAFRYVWGHESIPPFVSNTMIWYAVPALYILLGLTIVVWAYVRGNHCWTEIWPTLLFGMVSFIYALRAYSYWKLAVVSFPFIISVVYILYVLKTQWIEPAKPPIGNRIITVDDVLLGLSAVTMLALLASSFARDWNPKQIAPRFLFPALAVSILLVAGSAAVGRVTLRRSHTSAVVALAALILAVWFYNDATPQLFAAQLKKPRLAADTVRLVEMIAAPEGRLTRDHPAYVRDETLTYLRSAARDHRSVVMLAPGAGVYYFLAQLTPPNRFPEINITLADRWAQEVVDGLDRSRAELLVACNDAGRSMRGWPIRPVLSGFIAETYVDSGRRLSSQLLANCPFSIWVHRQAPGGVPADQSSGHADG